MTFPSPDRKVGDEDNSCEWIVVSCEKEILRCDQNDNDEIRSSNEHLFINSFHIRLLTCAAWKGSRFLGRGGGFPETLLSALCSIAYENSPVHKKRLAKCVKMLTMAHL